MPSGKTHDLITLLLAAPTFAVAWALTESVALAGIVTGATLFGGFMFGPDLDIMSRQYTRWGVFRFIWFPYRVVFRHRSRWSHGILFGTLIRVFYFAGMLTVITSAAVYLRAMLMAGGVLPGWNEVAHAWLSIESSIAVLGINRSAAWAVLSGLWWGAASHTLTDVGWSVVRKALEIF